MSPLNFPLRWESTGDKWWYASPIDFAAANGHYDLVRELLRIDGNHLIQLTSLRRIRRLEAVWDDEEQFDDVAKCRCEVAYQLFDECQTQSKGGKLKNSLIVAGYGGWLLYTAASAGDLSFVQKLLRKNPLLVFGEGEYGLTDILYAAARSKNTEVFKSVYDFAVSPRFLNEVGEVEEQTGEVPEAYKLEVLNRAVHAAARGGNLTVLQELLDGCTDVLGLRDANCSTVLHSAAGKGQVEVVKHLIASYGMISSVDDKGNTPLHVAAYRGQLPVLEVLIQASPLSAFAVNKAGDTFLHMAVAGFQTPGFRRLDQQIELMKQLVSSKSFIIEDVVNSRNNEGRTALHLAITGNIHSDLVQLLMSARFINVNIRDDHGMTPLDYLKRQPKSASSEILIRRLISVGGISSCKDYAVRKAFASHLKMQGICGSPGTSFRLSDGEIFTGTGIDHLVHSSGGRASKEHVHFQSFSEVSQCGSTSEEDKRTPDIKKSGPLHNAAKRLKTMFHWSLVKGKETMRSKRESEKEESSSEKRKSSSEETPLSLRERYSNVSSSSNNKRTLAARSNVSSPTNRKKLASGVTRDAFQDQLLANLSSQPSFTKSSLSSNSSLEQGKEICVEDESARPPCSKQINFDDTPKMTPKHGSMNKRFANPILCFGGSHSSFRNSAGKHGIKQAVHAAA